MSAPVQVTVSGGSAGITAHLDDLRGMAGLLHTAGQAVAEAQFDLGSPTLRWTVAGSAAASGCGADQAVTDLVALGAGLAALDRTIGAAAIVVEAAAVQYEDADRSMAAALLGGLAGLLVTHSEVARRLLSPGFQLPRVLAAVTLDGEPVVHDLGPSTVAAAPHTLADLVAGLSARNKGRPGEISVSFVTGADGRRRAVVDVPGTKSWIPQPVRDVTSVNTDIIAITGRRTSYERGIFTAMRAAGVDSDMPVLLVGHSEGGIVAVDAARHAARSGEFSITHVVTAGSPVGELARDLPPTVQLLALENGADVVPMLDTAGNPDRPNVTTVRASIDRGGVTANHDLDEVYVPEAAGADAACDESVDHFVTGADGFLDGAQVSTHAYLVTRGG